MAPPPGMPDPSSGALDPQGPAARAIADLWWAMLALGAATFVIFAAVLVAGLVRRRGPTDHPPGDRPDRLIVLGGVVLPALVLVVVMALTVRTMRQVPATAPAHAVAVEVVGHRWWYEVRYPDHGVVTANEVHLPVGRPVELRLTSADVIHSFWIPVLGGKLDMLPDHVTLVLEADRPGVHRSQCAEFCGLQHANMGLIAVVEAEADFDEWLAGQRAPAAAPASEVARRGQAVFSAGGCGTCHTVRGTPAAGQGGPDLTHLASRRTLAAATVPNTPEDLARWVRDPHEVKRGVVMPPARLDEGELAALLSYLGGLR
ncbi:MAG: cytochrome c oxidase subunit II [Acidimicrobiia bacterium]